MNSATGESENSSSMNSAYPCRLFTLAEIQSATENFDDKLVIGQGGFGKVFKGYISSEEGDHVVAIKRLDSMSNQGELEFRAEINMLSKLRHRHLVSLIGYCHENKEMILVYEYVSHGTVYHHLHKAHIPLSWLTWLKIAIGAALGLDYLHTSEVIHRDVKSSNILLDGNWKAMISDFGLSKIGPANQPVSCANASVKGTFGYLDPEYFYTRKLTRKSDVYSFGVVLFELLSGRRAVDEINEEDQCSLVRWAQRCVKERKLDQMVDSSIKGTISTKCLRGFAKIAHRCVHSDPKERPTMTEAMTSLQTLLYLQEKSYQSGESSGTVGFNWKIHQYFTKLNSEFMSKGNFADLLHRGALVQLPLVTKGKILVGIAREFVLLQKPKFYKTHQKVKVFFLDRHEILLDENFTAKLSVYDSGHYSIALPVIDECDLDRLQCDMWGYKVIFMEVLTGDRIYTSRKVAKINRFFTECGKESLDFIAQMCFEICNEVDSESKMLAILKKNNELIQERLESWLDDPDN